MFTERQKKEGNDDNDNTKFHGEAHKWRDWHLYQCEIMLHIFAFCPPSFIVNTLGRVPNHAFHRLIGNQLWSRLYYEMYHHIHTFASLKHLMPVYLHHMEKLKDKMALDTSSLSSSSVKGGMNLKLLKRSKQFLFEKKWISYTDDSRSYTLKQNPIPRNPRMALLMIDHAKRKIWNFLDSQKDNDQYLKIPSVERRIKQMPGYSYRRPNHRGKNNFRSPNVSSHGMIFAFTLSDQQIQLYDASADEFLDTPIQVATICKDSSIFIHSIQLTHHPIAQASSINAILADTSHEKLHGCAVYQLHVLCSGSEPCWLHFQIIDAWYYGPVSGSVTRAGHVPFCTLTKKIPLSSFIKNENQFKRIADLSHLVLQNITMIQVSGEEILLFKAYKPIAILQVVQKSSYQQLFQDVGKIPRFPIIIPTETNYSIVKAHLSDLTAFCSLPKEAVMLRLSCAYQGAPNITTCTHLILQGDSLQQCLTSEYYLTDSMNSEFEFSVEQSIFKNFVSFSPSGRYLYMNIDMNSHNDQDDMFDILSKNSEYVFHGGESWQTLNYPLHLAIHTSYSLSSIAAHDGHFLLSDNEMFCIGNTRVSSNHHELLKSHSPFLAGFSSDGSIIISIGKTLAILY